jgi:hypothetical protein
LHRKHDKFIGLDVHKDTIVLLVSRTVTAGSRVGGVRMYGIIARDLHALERVMSKFGVGLRASINKSKL